MSHTPIPWVLGLPDIGVKGKLRIYGADNKLVAWCESAKVDRLHYERLLSDDEANAEYIVRCVNSHDDLVQALKVALPILDTYRSEIHVYEEGSDCCCGVESALALVHTALEHAKQVQNELKQGR